MITVEILINGQPIMARSATNTGEINGDGKTIYRCDDGTILLHARDAGAVELAKKMLDTIKIH